MKMYSAADYQREVLLDKKTDDVRSEFRRDYTRLLHSAVFRRLQGKTQLFPSVESDFFRNRLTHSLEVSQIAKTLGMKLNKKLHKKMQIDLDLLEFSGLAHDLGHPPFGHNGERALDDCMKDAGGFEGNAQTLRLLTTSWKQEGGLNITYRSIASILKYDKLIPIGRTEDSKLVKGYYDSESELASRVKKKVAPAHDGKFKTIECQIMDLADDIAYSTYDLEDALKAGFYTPLEMLAATDELLGSVASKVECETGKKITNEQVWRIVYNVFSSILNKEEKRLGNLLLLEMGMKEADTESVVSAGVNGMLSTDQYGAAMARLSAEIFKLSRKIVADSSERTKLTSSLIDRFVNSIDGIEIDSNSPALSKLKINKSIQVEIEVLKHFAYESLITSSRLKVVEYRGYDIVRKLFEALSDDHRKGYMLLPDDYRNSYIGVSDNNEKKRIVCDFIAGMTDRYAVEYFSRLYSYENGASMFKPL